MYKHILLLTSTCTKKQIQVEKMNAALKRLLVTDGKTAYMSFHGDNYLME